MRPWPTGVLAALWSTAALLASQAVADPFARSAPRPPPAVVYYDYGAEDGPLTAMCNGRAFWRAEHGNRAPCYRGCAEIAKEDVAADDPGCEYRYEFLACVRWCEAHGASDTFPVYGPPGEDL